MKQLKTIEQVSDLFDKLYPICRSILGDGYRESLKILQDYIPLTEEEYPSGEKVLNWTVPQEWIIREAWIKDSKGNTVLDFKWNNLHVINYSDNVDKVLNLSELENHIYTSDASPEAIPYTTSYYKKRWGFCMSQIQKEKLKEDNYHVYIDSEFINGKLVIGESILEGESKQEILLSSYLCHPTMANNELSGPLVLAMLYQRIKNWSKRKYTYRFLINPETIGSISYLSRHGQALQRDMMAGIVLTCLGGNEPIRYQKSRVGNSVLDNVMKDLKIDYPDEYIIEEFDPTDGSDERQYCSPGFNLPVGQFARKVYGKYKEYHTSLDTKELMGIENIIDSCDKMERILKQLESKSIDKLPLDEQKEIEIGKFYYKNKYPYGEIKLGDYQLYPTLNSSGVILDEKEAILNESWFIDSVMMILNYSDGIHSLEYCANRLGIEFEKVKAVAELLVKKGLLELV